MTRKQIIKAIFNYSYSKESGNNKYLKITTTDGAIYNCIDPELNTNSLEAENIRINYNDIKSIVAY